MNNLKDERVPSNTLATQFAIASAVSNMLYLRENEPLEVDVEDIISSLRQVLFSKCEDITTLETAGKRPMAYHMYNICFQDLQSKLGGAGNLNNGVHKRFWKVL